MGQLIKVTGIVLSARNVGEYDKRMVILTKEKGKLSAFARGARKMGSPYLAACQSFSYGTFTLFSGKNYNVNAVDIEDYFPELKADLTKLYTGLYFCEMADYFTIEGNDDLQIMKLLYVSLQALRHGKIRPELIRYIFELKCMAYFGWMMETHRCINCQKEEELTSFHAGKGGMLCKSCGKLLSGAIPVCESTLYTLQYIMNAEVTKLYTFEVSDAVLHELKHVSQAYMKTQVDHHFKSLGFLELM